eukprot:2728478-Rhodomonas_salina.1
MCAYEGTAGGGGWYRSAGSTEVGSAMVLGVGSAGPGSDAQYCREWTTLEDLAPKVCAYCMCLRNCELLAYTAPTRCPVLTRDMLLQAEAE